MSKVLALYAFQDTERKDDFVFSSVCNHFPMYAISRFLLIFFLKWRNKQGNMTLAIIVYDAFWQTAGSRFSDGNYYWTNFIINRSLVTAWKWGNVKVKDNVLILVLVIKIIDIWFWTLFKKRDFSFRNTVFKVRVSYALMKCGKELEVYVGITLTLWFLTSY